MRLKQRATLKQEKENREKTDAKKMMLMSDDGEENGDDNDLEGQYHLGDHGKDLTDAEKAQKMLKEEAESRSKQLLNLIKFLPMALKEHFQDIWNFFDVVIFGLAAVVVPMWIYIMNLHWSNFPRNPGQDAN